MKVPNKVDIQTFFDSDRAILVACIFIALVFWFLVKLSQTFYPTAEFQINYTLPVGKTFVSSPPSSVKATLKGTGWDLISYEFKNKESSILFEINDVASQAINANLITDKIQEILSPPTLEVSDINTDFIFVQMESETEIKVPINLNQNIRLASQFQLADSIRFEPENIILTGPLTEVESIQSWETELLDLENLKENKIVEVQLKAPENKEVHLSQQSVIVTIAVEQFTEKSLFVPITVKNAPDSLKTFPERAKISCIVGLSKFNDIDQSSFQLLVDLKDIPLNTEKNTIPVLLTRQPDYARAINFQPKSVEFFFVETVKDTLNEPIIEE